MKMKSKMASPAVELGYSSESGAWAINHVPELISQRAYQLFQNRRQLPGCELEDWLQAEREVKHHLGL